MARWDGHAREERDGTLWCTSCEDWLPAKQFKNRSRQPNNPKSTMCNRCLYVKYTRPNAERKTAEVHAYKLMKGCQDCGYNRHPEALDFDHRPGESKLFNIGEKVSVYKLDRVWAEIAKCDVVCRNCHAVRTAERRQRVELVGR